MILALAASWLFLFVCAFGAAVERLAGRRGVPPTWVPPRSRVGAGAKAGTRPGPLAGGTTNGRSRPSSL